MGPVATVIVCKIEPLWIEAWSVLTNADHNRDALDGFLANLADAVAVRQRVGNISRQDTAHAVRSRGFFHSSRYVDRVAVNGDRTFRVPLLAHDYVATMDTDPKTRDDSE